MVGHRIQQESRAFRFYDNREKYLLLVAICNEKQIIVKGGVKTYQRGGAKLYH